MDAREGNGMPSFYLNQGVVGSGSVVGSGLGSGSGSHMGGANIPPGFIRQANPNSPHSHSYVNVGVGPIGGSSYPVEHTPPSNFHNGINISGGGGGDGGGSGGGGGGGAAAIATPGSESDPAVKRKRGRPRIYNVDGSQMNVALKSASSARESPGSGTPNPKRNKGRPPGTGRKQILANSGEWMSSSAGLAFTPHVIFIETGEDVAAKIYSFAQQRPRGLCITSAIGSVSEMQLRKIPSSGGTENYEGPFQILSLSGSYLLPESGAPNSRTGGLSISVSSPDVHAIGGAIGGRLIASSMVQVVAFSFVYDGKKSKKAIGTPSASEKSPIVKPPNNTNPAPSQAIPWTQDAQAGRRKVYTEMDLYGG